MEIWRIVESTPTLFGICVMKVLPKTALFAVILTSALSAACSSSTDTPSTMNDDSSETPVQQPPVTDQEVDPTDGEQDPVDGEQPVIDEENDLFGDDDTPDLGMLIPSVTEGGDLDRLVRGLTRQVSATLLDLNTRLAEGTELTEQQDICLGAYDPAFGEQLLAVDCEQALATGDVAIYVESASFYNTASCNSDISEGTSASCVLQDARITIPTEWIIPEVADDTTDAVRERPVPVAGMEIYYAVSDSNLRIENTEGALTGIFRCDLDLTDEVATTTIPVQSCADIIMQTADRIDALQPEE